VGPLAAPAAHADPTGVAHTQPIESTGCLPDAAEARMIERRSAAGVVGLHGQSSIRPTYGAKPAPVVFLLFE
jgi:hypothetical protein